MSRMPGGSRAPTKDMYWFAHGGIETNSDKCLTQINTTSGECDDESGDSISPTWKSLSDRKGLPDDQKSIKDNAYPAVIDGGNNSLSPTSERDDRLRLSDKRMAVEERKKQLWEAEQERNDAVMRKHMEREAALEARRNAQRSNIAFAFGSSVPRNVETLQAGGDSEKVNRQYGASGLQHKEENYETHHERRSVSPFNYSGHSFLIDSNSPHSISSQCVYSERQSISPSCWLVGSGALIGDDMMSRSMTAAVPAPRGRRKNDLMPTVPYDRTATPTTSKTSSSSPRKRSVSMTRLDQLAQPRRHYVEATKASSTASSGGASSMLKDNFRSPTRPLSSASEQSGGSGRVPGYVNRRVRSSPRKPRPVSIAGTIPDQKPPSDAKMSPTKRSYTPAKKTPVVEVKKSVVNAKAPLSKPAEKTKPVEKAKSAPRIPSTLKATKQPAAPKLQTVKQQSSTKTSTPKVPAAKKSSTNKKKSDILVASTAAPEETENQSLDIKSSSPPSTPPPDNASVEAEKNAKRIISEEEAKAALAEKRRLAREQAEREAELERQRQEELRLQEEERIRKEEEEQKRMEEETLHLLEEHRRQEEEKLKKAIEEQERKEEEERTKREEELRIKAEQERKAHEEAEKQRIELEEKLRKEEEERAERKKRLEKIMSRTRGKTSGSSPSGSVSSDQLDSGENPQDGFSSGANSLDSNEAGDIASGPASVECKTESLSVGNSLEANPTYEIASGNESLNSNDIVMPSSETASQDNSMVIIPDDSTLHVSSATDISISDIQNPVPSESQILPPSNSELPINCDEAVLSENVPVKDSFLNDEYLDKQNDKADLDTSEIPSTVTESMHQPFSGDNEYHENIEPSELNEKASTEDFSHVESSMLLETSDVDNRKPVAASDVVLSFNEDSINQMPDFISSENSNVINTDTLDYVLSQTTENLKLEDATLSSALTLEQVVSEEAEIIESNSRNSVSSDMKLPDPIYETSDEGSVSSEKHNQDFNAYMLQEHNLENSNQEPVPMSDDVFSEQEPVYKNPDFTYQVSNPFSENQEKNSNVTDDLYAEQFHTEQSKSMMEHTDIYYEKPVTDMFQVQHSDLSQASITENPFVVDNDGNKENVETQDLGNIFSSAMNNPFSCDENQKLNEFDIYADKENVQFTSSNVEDSNENVHEMHKTCSDQTVFAQDGVNPFLQQSIFSSNSEINVLQHQDNDPCNIQENELVMSDAVHDLKSQADVNEPCEFSSVVNDVTIIKAEGSEDCIGIISSVDHDQISNDFPKQSLLNEHLKSNFEYASITDSEDSSLDSNLSQVMTVETSEKELIGGLTHTQKLSESEMIKSASNNIEQTEHPFNIEHTYNGDSISKSNGTHFCASEIISNGHRIETSDQIDQISEFHEYVQIGGNDISSVDHSKTNIFENVDAIDFSKVSPDPFLAKGNSNQISGNPFLLQDDQKQVLVTPDFLN